MHVTSFMKISLRLFIAIQFEKSVFISMLRSINDYVMAHESWVSEIVIIEFHNPSLINQTGYSKPKKP